MQRPSLARTTPTIRYTVATVSPSTVVCSRHWQPLAATRLVRIRLPEAEALHRISNSSSRLHDHPFHNSNNNSSNRRWLVGYCRYRSRYRTLSSQVHTIPTTKHWLQWAEMHSGRTRQEGEEEDLLRDSNNNNREEGVGHSHPPNLLSPTLTIPIIRYTVATVTHLTLSHLDPRGCRRRRVWCR